MPPQKSFWRKYEFFIVSVSTLLFIYFLVILNQKINFFLGNELIISLKPEQKSFYTHYGDINQAEFDVSIDNVAYCKVNCSYSLNDRSRNEIIDRNDFFLQKGEHIIKNYNLSVKRLGSGQDIYSFDVMCHSMRSLVCLTSSPKTFRSSLVTVNYDLTETEKEFKKILKQNVTQLLESLKNADIMHRQLNQKYFELGFKVNLLNLSRQKIEIDDVYDKTSVSIENLRSLWSVENYIRLNQIFNGTFFNTLDEIKNSIFDLDQEIDNMVELHNALLQKLNFLSGNARELGSFVNILEDNQTSKNFYNYTNRFSELASSLVNNTFDSYPKIIQDLDNITKQQNSIIAESKIPFAKIFFYYEYYYGYQKNFLCTLKQDCTENISVAGPIKNTEEFMQSYPNVTMLKQNCDLLKGLGSEYLSIQNQTLSFISDKNISFPSDITFLNSVQEFRDNELRKINNSYYASFEKIISENKTNADAIQIAESFLPKNESNITIPQHNNSVNISLYILSNISYIYKISEMPEECAKLDKYKIGIQNFDFVFVSMNVTHNITSKLDTNLSDNPPICCIFNDCNPCCRDESCKNDPKTFPVILLHGHSFAKDNSPEFSLDSFNMMQLKLQDDGYLNAGIVSLYSRNENLQQGIWGLSGRPVTVKSSYYYDAFRAEEKYIAVPTKSENIDTYALRLKELIDIVKERTSKPKVKIIAHSMGGLVARRYMQVFGDDEIDKLIMIATPNKGIFGPISDYCGLIGENRECNDMQEHSLFLNKLNDPANQPHNVKLYTIIGEGCQMKNGKGDGVVLAKNAKLNNATTYLIKGTCTGLFGETLHTEILNVGKYPKTYDIIKKILKE